MMGRMTNVEHELVPVANATAISFAVSTSVVDSPAFADAADEANYVRVSVRDDAVLVTTDREDPSATVGLHYEADTVPFTMAIEAFRKAKWLRHATDAVIYAEPMISHN